MNRLEKITALSKNPDMAQLCEHLYNISMQADELEDSVMLEQIDTSLALLSHNDNSVHFTNESKSKNTTTLTGHFSVSDPDTALSELLENIIYFNNYIDNVEVSFTNKGSDISIEVSYENSNNKVLNVYVQSVIISFVNTFANDFLLKNENNIQFSV